MEAACCSKMSLNLYQYLRCHIPKDFFAVNCCLKDRNLRDNFMHADCSWKGYCSRLCSLQGIYLHESHKDSLNSVFGVVTALQLDGRGFNASQGQKIFLFSEIPRLVLWPTQPPSIHVWGTCWGLECMGCEVHCQQPLTTEIKNEWSCISSCHPCHGERQLHVSLQSHRCSEWACSQQKILHHLSCFRTLYVKRNSDNVLMWKYLV